jgi:tRNA pseudouridine55 synthase
VLIGKGSRLAPFLIGQDKLYAATVRFGSGTDTLDREGRIIARAPVPESASVVAEALVAFRGTISQIPPMISALKRDGQPLYKRARRGEQPVEPEARPVTIHELTCTGFRWGESAADQADSEKGLVPESGLVHEVDLLVRCSSGTYVRSLARDLAQAVGSEGHLHQLRRLAVGSFRIQQALTGALDLTGEQLLAAVLPPADALPDLPVIVLDPEECRAVRQGVQPAREWLDRLSGEPVALGKSTPAFRMLDEMGRLVGVGRWDAARGAATIALVIPGEQVSCD